MRTEQDFQFLMAAVEAEFHDFKIVNKGKSTLMKAIGFFLKAITFGQMTAFMTSFTTTLGTTVYVPEGWYNRPVESRMAVLRHERVHMRQARDKGRFWFSLSYAFLPFPTVFAYFRRKFEQEAYEESMRSMVEFYGAEYLKNPKVRETMIKHFTSAEYFWTWPWKKSIERWYDEAVAKLSGPEA